MAQRDGGADGGRAEARPHGVDGIASPGPTRTAHLGAYFPRTSTERRRSRTCAGGVKFQLELLALRSTYGQEPGQR